MLRFFSHISIRCFIFLSHFLTSTLLPFSDILHIYYIHANPFRTFQFLYLSRRIVINRPAYFARRSKPYASTIRPKRDLILSFSGPSPPPPPTPSLSAYIPLFSFSVLTTFSSHSSYQSRSNSQPNLGISGLTLVAFFNVSNNHRPPLQTNHAIVSNYYKLILKQYRILYPHPYSSLVGLSVLRLPFHYTLHSLQYLNSIILTQYLTPPPLLITYPSASASNRRKYCSS